MELTRFPSQHDATLEKISVDLGEYYVYIADADTIVPINSPLYTGDYDKDLLLSPHMRGLMIGNQTQWMLPLQTPNPSPYDHILEVDGYKGDIVWSWAYIPIIEDGYVATDPLHIRVKYYNRLYLAKGYDEILNEVAPGFLEFTSTPWISAKLDEKDQLPDQVIYKGKWVENLVSLPNTAWADLDNVDRWKWYLVAPRNIKNFYEYTEGMVDLTDVFGWRVKVNVNYFRENKDPSPNEKLMIARWTLSDNFSNAISKGLYPSNPFKIYKLTGDMKFFILNPSPATGKKNMTVMMHANGHSLHRVLWSSLLDGSRYHIIETIPIQQYLFPKREGDNKWPYSMSVIKHRKLLELVTSLTDKTLNPLVIHLGSMQLIDIA